MHRNKIDKYHDYVIMDIVWHEIIKYRMRSDDCKNGHVIIYEHLYVMDAINVYVWDIYVWDEINKQHGSEIMFVFFMFLIFIT